MELIIAQRKQAVIKMAIQGPSGSGKTYSSLLIANGLCKDWSKIVIIDTEYHSAHLYSALGPYKVLSLEEPFSPERYIESIEACENAGMKVIIIDSISHEWEGLGGILDVHGSMAGNSFTNWSKLTPRHNAFVQKILQSPCHIIATIRSKQDYVLTDKNGKMVPEKVGLKGVTRDGMDYEFSLVLDLDIKHHASASKDRTGLFMDKLSFAPSPLTGEMIRTWCMGDELMDHVNKQITAACTIPELRSILIKYPTLRNKIEPLCIQRKNEIEREITENVVEPIKNEEHGSSSS
ncbi:MAG TPA: AAA family ATPase [Bacteroidales bacterium]|nr:AAA family ATPase [Bacteroidales bacterium]